MTPKPPATMQTADGEFIDVTYDNLAISLIEAFVFTYGDCTPEHMTLFRLWACRTFQATNGFNVQNFPPQ